MCMDCMISGIFFHQLAKETKGDFEVAVARLDQYIEAKEEATDITVLGIGLIVSLLSSSARPLVVRMTETMHLGYQRYVWLAEWAASAITAGIDNSEDGEALELIQLEVDTFIFSHDRDDCVKMAASILYHYYWMVIGNQATVLDYTRFNQRPKP